MGCILIGIFLIVMVFSLIFALFNGIEMLKNDIALRRMGVSTKGVIQKKQMEVRTQSEGPDEYFNTIHFEFSTHQGELINGKTEVSSLYKKKEGHMIDVFYLPDNPSVVSIDTPITTNHVIVEALFFLFAIVFWSFITQFIFLDFWEHCYMR